MIVNYLSIVSLSLLIFSTILFFVVKYKLEESAGHTEKKRKTLYLKNGLVEEEQDSQDNRDSQIDSEVDGRKQ